MASDDLGSYLGLVRGLVRQHRTARKIADREYVRHIGAHLLVDRDDAALIDIHTGLAGIQLVAIGAPADSHQHLVVNAL